MTSLQPWFDAICESYEKPSAYFDGKLLPAFPPDQIQINTTGQAGVNTLREAFVFFEDCATTFTELGVPMKSESKLLDFGVGWGRIARFFLRDIPIENIYGLDVMEEFVAICKETFRSTNFHTTAPFPPSILKESTFDFVVGYSVFSHLSEQACKAWMGEFARVTKPGAIVALTTRGRPFFDYCESLKNKGLGGYSDSLANMFSDFGAARADYDAGKIVHSNAYGVTGGGAMTADFYGETFIPKAYAKQAYSEYFVLEKFMYDPARQSHPIMFFRRK
jgi:SAM-dependent methyltransferase